VTETQLRAPMEIAFDYTRSLGPVLSQFMTALRDGRILGARGADGRVHAPPFEYDRSFGWALIRLDGADTAMLHAVDASGSAAMRIGMRVRARWAADRVGSIRDIACFEPGDAPAADAADHADHSDPVTMTITPVRLRYQHTASAAESVYLRGLADGRLIGQRCPACGKVYIPSRGVCPADGVPADSQVELPDTGTVTTFSIVNVGYPGQRVTPPYVAAAVLLDGADIAFQHLILGCDPAEVHLGMRVRAVWRPAGERDTTAETISHFAPAGQPDAPYETYARFI
jgi:uncharacterized OB-fold protein